MTLPRKTLEAARIALEREIIYWHNLGDLKKERSLKWHLYLFKKELETLVEGKE